MRADSHGSASRRPAVAGLFYPGDAPSLRTQVLDLIAAVAVAPQAAPKALIAPHAGYIYSGPVAAAAFAMLRDAAQVVRRVVLIGPSHFVQLRGIAAPTADEFETPLGRVPVDAEALSAIAGLGCVLQADAPHAREHALEVELPFLQMLLSSFSLVPLVAGEATPQEVADVLRPLWGGRETLIVISSDLSHYHDYDTASRIDAATAVAIERGDWAALGPDRACGYLPLAGLLVEAERRRLKPRRLALCNSGDTAGSRDQVVGYGAWMFAEGG